MSDEQTDEPTQEDGPVLLFDPSATPEGFRSGFVALIGRPNAGKSTLVNALMGTKVSIATPRPQTTRNRIRAVHLIEGRAQVVFVDTPGIHMWQEKKLNELMVHAALAALADADAVLFLVDATRCTKKDGTLSDLELYIIEQLHEVLNAGEQKSPVILGINKIDLLESPEFALPIIELFQDSYPFADVIGLSALNDRNVDLVMDTVVEQLPEGPMLYPADIFTDQAERFIAAEMIREQITLLTHKEIPYSVAVEVSKFEDDSQRGVLQIGAVIHVERESQKGIIIGKRGAMLKRIGSRSRVEIERFFGRRVFLETFVRVQKEWSQDVRSLNRFGYDENS